MWQNLAGNMALLIKEYQKLLDLNEEKRRILVRVDMKALEKLLSREESILNAIHKAENSRREMLQEMASANSDIRPDMRMVELLHKCHNPEKRDQLHKLHIMLDKIVKDVQAATDNNAIIIKAALNAVNFRLNQLGGTSADGGYGRGGKEHITHEKNFDFQA